jgi:putative transposase
MPRGPRLLIDNACYHIYTRGNHKHNVFNAGEDYETYRLRLKKYKDRYGFLLYGYCLMSNHPHIIGEIENSKDLSHFMHDLNRSYTAFFNKKYEKVGYLWQGRFQTRIITKDQYLINCINYIELNPVRAGLVKAPLDYPYSSYRERVFGVDKKLSMLSKLTL